MHNARNLSIAIGHVLQIVPPGRGGVRDHATALTKGLRLHDIDAPIIGIGRDDGTAALRAALTRPMPVILHFSGYGYAPRGLCFWLVRLLDDLRHEGRITRLIVFFHEISAFGPPWTSAFYTAFPQRQIARRLCRMADAVLTNCHRHASVLRPMSGGKVQALPVFSNIGELPAAARQADVREPVAIAFGTLRSRGHAVTLVTRLPANGPPVREYGIGGPSALTEHGADYRGEQEASALSAILAGAAYGLVWHPPFAIAKSGIFAAYAAHGCIPVLGESKGAEADGLSHGVHFILPEDIAGLTPMDATRIRQAVSDWYDGHTLARQAAVVRGALSLNPAPSVPSNGSSSV
jgi:hypothetical protein